MIGYEDVYETLRKEKYGENLQQLPAKFVEDFAKFTHEMKSEDSGSSEVGGVFDSPDMKSRKELENALAMFKELMLRRKKKLLNLVFVAVETGVMKKDYENMLSFERDLFDKLVKAVEDGDKELGKVLHGSSDGEKKNKGNRLIMFNQDVDEFVDMNGEGVGPFTSGELVNLSSQVAEVLVEGGKAGYVDED